jgi:fibronectin type 3 domain-containing protein
LLQLASNSVIVPAGTTSTTFTATAGRVSTNHNATLTAVALHSVWVNWSASVSPNLTNYKVYRATTSGGPYGVITTVGLVSSYVDSNIQNGQTYYYVATAVDATGAESGYSNEASAAVPDGVSQSATIRLVAIPSRRVSGTGPFPLPRRSPACGASLPESAPQ